MTSSDATEQVGDCGDDFVEEEEDQADNMVFPNMLAALQSHQNQEMMALLPRVVKRRIKALKKLQLEQTNLEVEFFKEVHALECKYHEKYVPLYEKRGKIITSEYEPTDAECEYPSDEEAEELAEELKEKAKIEEDKDVKGIPNFWLTAFRNVSILSEMVQPHDEPILVHLKDIKVICSSEPMKFEIQFVFGPNEYFTDTVLTKEYHLKCEPDADDPFSFEGPEIYKCSGCTINWNKGKNVTLKTVKKKQKHKSRGVVRTVTKTVQNDSFFNFFSPPIVPDDTKEEDIDEDLRNLLTNDFEIGHYIRERVVPRAVLYFTGEGADDEDFDEEEDDDEEYEEEEDGDDNVAAKGGKKNNENCKQQ